MKILIINQHPQDIIGGGEIQCHLLATHFVQLGHEVVYLAIHGKRPSYATTYSVIPIFLRFQELRRVVASQQPDVVYWRFSKFHLLSSAMAIKLAGAKMIIGICNVYDVRKWSHKVTFHVTGLKAQLRRWYMMGRQLLSSRINHFGYYFVDGVIAQTKEQTQKLPVGKEALIYSLVDETVTPFTWHKPFVLWVASVKPRKNPEAYIELAKRFQHLEVDFLMIGDIAVSQYVYLKNQASLPPNVRYLGVKEYTEVNGMLQQALFLVHTTYGPEGFPNVFIQAWIQGKPIISLYCDPDQFIQQYQLGYVSGHFEQFIQDVTVLLEKPELRVKIGQRAKVISQQYFSTETNVRQIETFFREVCQQ